jgi:hypothetical protein
VTLSSRSWPARIAKSTLGAAAIGAIAVGAIAVGAIAIGRLSVGSLRMRRGYIKTLRIEELEVGRLTIREPTNDGSNHSFP